MAEFAIDKHTSLTCGVCTSIVNKDEIQHHSCVKDWGTITINSRTNTFYPTNGKGEYLAKIKWNGKEQILWLKNVSKQTPVKETQNNDCVPESIIGDKCCALENRNIITNSTVSQNSPEQLDNTVIEELLIEEVRKRPPLYDYTLPLSVRGRQKIADLWKEISEALNGVMNPENAKKRWKTLKDTFSKIVAEEKKPSGAARTPKKCWKHLEQMSFLRSVSTNRNSISNLAMNTSEPLSSNTLLEDNGLDNMEEYKSTEDQPLKRRNKGNEDLLSSINRIVDVLCNKETPVISLPKPPEICALDGMFIYIKERLQKLPSEKQDQLLMKFLHDITKEEQNEHK